MSATPTETRIALQNILYLTDFSQSSEAAIPFLRTVAAEYEARIHLLHVLMPVPIVCPTPEAFDAVYRGQQEGAQYAMHRLETQLAGLPCDGVIEHAAAVWPSVERAVQRFHADLIVIGTHGRTGAAKLMLGSVAEEILRRSPVPVLTVGPWSRENQRAKFHSVLFATDFTVESLAAAPFAVSMAEENQARLTLLNVKPEPGDRPLRSVVQEGSEATIRSLHDLVPQGAEFWCAPEAMVRFGDPIRQILETAQAQSADLIVMGVRSAAGHLGAATHLERAVVHNVIANATCPVLTVRG